MKNKPILICFGTRPEWLKVKPLIDLMNKTEYRLLFTGQHIDLLKDVQVDYRIKISDNSNRLDSVGRAKFRINNQAYCFCCWTEISCGRFWC
jgi:UDP-N-acetylglucosamine 2-epimerase